jgi:hypothetical protein
MLQIIKQRPYIENFCEFVSSFGITEQFTISEMELVEANTKILLERIQRIKENTSITASPGN